MAEIIILKMALNFIQRHFCLQCERNSDGHINAVFGIAIEILVYKFIKIKAENYRCFLLFLFLCAVHIKKMTVYTFLKILAKKSVKL